MDLPVNERAEKLNTISSLTNTMDQKIGNFLFMPKEIVWLVHEIKSFNIEWKKMKKAKKLKKRKMETS